MLQLELLPAACGDCLWLEYGDPAPGRIVIIDGGLRSTADVLRQRLQRAREARGVQTLEVELLVVTHIDNDHIVGVIDLLERAGPELHIRDLWFNGRPQLMQLPAAQGRADPAADGRPADTLGGTRGTDAALSASPADLLGRQQADDLSALLARQARPCNAQAPWHGGPVLVPDAGPLPALTLPGGLRLTVLGPTATRLHRLCALWSAVLGGQDEGGRTRGPADLLGRKDSWPPVWKDRETADSSAANGSSIALLAEFGPHALLLAGDAWAPDLQAALGRVAQSRGLPPGTPLPLSAFKLPHHGSENNLTRALMDSVDCTRFLVSTDGSVHRHPDHQALLRVLRYARRRPELLFNHACDTTRPWRDRKADVLKHGRDYGTAFPDDPAKGFVLTLP